MLKSQNSRSEKHKLWQRFFRRPLPLKNLGVLALVTVAAVGSGCAKSESQAEADRSSHEQVATASPDEFAAEPSPAEPSPAEPSTTASPPTAPAPVAYADAAPAAQSSASAEHAGHAAGQPTAAPQNSGMAHRLPARSAQDAMSASSGSESASEPAATDLAEHATETVEAFVGNRVDVFFATDRLPTEELMPGFGRVFAPAAVVAMLCCAMFIGLSAARRFQALWLVGSGVSLCLGIVVLHHSIVRWQQYSRLANDASTRFSVFRYESGENYPLHLGLAKVSMPKSHQVGQVESPELIRLEFIESPDKHVVLHSLRVEQPDAWFDLVSQRAEKANAGEEFLFIHGYNVRFSDALKRTAQLATDLELSGPAICYSWPSRGQVAAYTVDEATVSWSAPHLERLLIDLHAKTKCKAVNIIAHSMGNRALLEAIERLSLRTGAASVSAEPLPTRPINNLVLAAPDVDIAQFESRYSKLLEQVASRTTIYVSDTDRALQLSENLHGADRLGLFRQQSTKWAGIDTIHIGKQSVFSLGHSYYGSDPLVIADLKSLLRDRLPAERRDALVRVDAPAVDTDQGGLYRLDRRLQATASSPNAY